MSFAEPKRHAGSTTPRVRVLGVTVDAITLDEAVLQIGEWLEDADSRCRYVVTPNLDHAVLLQRDVAFRAVYQNAALIIPDGMPMVWASRLNGSPLRERVAGSDLIPALFAQRRPGSSPELRVFFLGAAPGVAERAAEQVQSRHAHVRVVGTCAPPLGFEKRPEENAAIVRQVNDAAPHLLVIGFGAPKQELWIHKHADALRCGVAICAGATIDFLAGHRRRAPPWMQKTGTEWLHRALSEPRRLVPRYARDACYLPGLLYGDWKAARRTSDGA